ncbi:MAG: DUF5655 domain-containing protein [Longimicrobiales bacterium]
MCPRCERRFQTPNHPHACGPWTVEAYLSGRSSHEVLLFHAFQRQVERCGFVLVVPGKKRVSFQARQIFATIDALNSKALSAHVLLARRVENRRFERIERGGPRQYLHHFKIRSLSELDREVMDWLEEAYAVGMMPSLERPDSPRPSFGLGSFGGSV